MFYVYDGSWDFFYLPSSLIYASFWKWNGQKWAKFVYSSFQVSSYIFLESSLWSSRRNGIECKKSLPKHFTLLNGQPILFYMISNLDFLKFVALINQASLEMRLSAIIALSYLGWKQFRKLLWGKNSYEGTNSWEITEKLSNIFQ